MCGYSWSLLFSGIQMNPAQLFQELVMDGYSQPQVCHENLRRTQICDKHVFIILLRSIMCKCRDYNACLHTTPTLTH